MLQYLGLSSYTIRIQSALEKTLKNGIKARDIGDSASTMQFKEAIVENIQSVVANAPMHDKHIRVVIPKPETHFDHAPWKTTGIDIFVQSSEALPSLPETIGKFTLKLLSNCGAKINSANSRDILLTDCYSLRWIADTPADYQDLQNFLQNFPSDIYPWMHIEILHNEEIIPMYSKIQGE